MSHSFVTHAEPNIVIERWQQIEGDIRRLKVLGISTSYVHDDRSQRAFPRRRHQWFALGHCSCVHACEHAGSDRLRVALYARDLSGKEDLRETSQLKRGCEQRRSIDVSVAMDLSIAQEVRIFEPGDQPQHPRLLSVFQMILEADQIVGIRALVLLAQLHYRVRNLSGAWIFESHRLHWTKAQRLAPAPRDLLNRQTAFKVVQLLPVLAFDRLRLDQRVIKTIVLLLREWAIDVVRRAFVIARRKVDARHVD